jgi:two-component system nitrogen regulation sensor histidine kinase NtrY
LAFSFGVLTYVAWQGRALNFSEHKGFTLIYLDIALFLLTSFLAAQRLAELWSEKRKGLAGSKIQTKLTLVFSVLAVLPCLVVTIFSAIFFHGEVESWFTKRNQAALTTARQVAESYLKEHQKNIIEDANAVAYMLAHQMPMLPSSENIRNNFVSQLANLKSLADIIVFDRTCAVIARSKLSFAAEFAPIEDKDLMMALKQKVVLISGSDYRFARALVTTEIENDVFFVLVGRPLDMSVMEYMEKTKATVQEYENIQSKRWRLEAGFIVVFLAVGLLLIFAAVSIALTISWQLTRPISRLINAAEKIRRGDMNARVPERNNQEELDLLSKVFNQMVNDLIFQKKSLEETNDQLESRSKFIEDVVSSVSSGILSLDRSRKIVFVNQAASNFFKADRSKCLNKSIQKLLPEIKDALDRAYSLKKSYEAELQIEFEKSARFLFVRVIYDAGAGGYVVTLDDMTELFVAQKRAAWSDVARRVAHEIKNPLTPIQLAAERIQRKYVKQITVEQEVFSRLTKTIIEQVDDIRYLIDAFSLFAKMPSPTITKFDLAKVFRDVLLLHQVANPDITFVDNCKYDTLIVEGDARMLHQAVSNIVLNSIKAIKEVAIKPNHPQISGNVLGRDSKTEIVIEDNGPGFPEEYREKLTDPYVTMSPNGTGLGLAIVKKIVFDHSGELFLENASGGGARVSILIPKNQS